MKTVIVGLGPAGLAAALELTDAGYAPHLYEARDRVGGRLQTVREGGLVYEAGGEWIDADHERILGLLARFGQTPLESNQRPGKVLCRGEFSVEGNVWPDATLDEENFENEADLLVLDLDDTPWDNLLYSGLDELNLGAFIQRIAKSERGRWYLDAVYRSDEGEEPSRIGLLGWLCGYMKYLERDPLAMSRYRFPEGAQGFCERILAETGLEPHLGNPLKKVSWSDDSVLLTFEKGTIAADHVILAIPPVALRKIEFQPELPEHIDSAIQDAPMSRTIKISLFFRTKWWLDLDWKGRMYCDLPIQQIWDATLGETPVMNCYICGQDAEDFANHADPVARAIELLAKVFPQAGEEFVGGRTHDWIGDPWAGGGFPYSPPGFVLNGLEYLNSKVGPIHFAGDHAASWIGFIEGAIESGQRAAREVL
ncbi:MAG: FAD-dependent oxidoreductase [Armatimonadetes bacterium]|nr:FAD-dependent oxidoreductase [Armatimonadota bacterium]